MNKKLFSWKALAGLALLVAMGLTSCKQGAEVDPSDPTGANKPVVVDPKVVTDGASITLTVNSIDKLNEFLVSEDVAKVIKNNSTINLSIAGLDNVELKAAAKVTLPAGFDDKTLNITLDKAFKTQTAELTFEDLNNLYNLNFIVNDKFGAVKVNVKYATVTISGTGSIEELASDNTGKGMTLKASVGGIKQGCIVGTKPLKVDGGDVDALITNGTSVFASKEGYAAINNVIGSDDKQYFVDDLIVTGTTDVYNWNSDNKAKFNTVVVAPDAELYMYAKADEIIGRLDADGKVAAKVYGNLDNVAKTSSVIFERNYFSVKNTIANCTIKANDVVFANTVNTVEKCTFELLDAENNSNMSIRFNVPGQESDSYTFTYNGCTFPTTAKFNVGSYGSSIPVVDADGNEVKVKWYGWFVLDEDGNKIVESTWTDDDGTHTSYKVAESMEYADVPLANRKLDNGGDYFWSYESTSYNNLDTFKDFTVFMAFKGCKVGSAAISNKTSNVWTSAYTTSGVTVKYNVDGTIYRTVYNNGQYILVKSN